MLAAVAMCIQFRSYLRGARFTLRTDHKSLVWLHRFRDTEGMMSRWLHALQQFQFSIAHRERITVTPTVSHAPQLRHVDNAPVQTAHRSSCFKTMQTNHSTLPRPVARRMPIWCRSSREKTGLLNSTMTWHNRPPFLETHSEFRLSSARTLCVSHCIHGLLLANLHHGPRLRACFRSSVCCGIISTIYRLTTMAFCGPPPPFGKYPHQSSLGPYCNGYPGRL